MTNATMLRCADSRKHNTQTSKTINPKIIRNKPKLKLKKDPDKTWSKNIYLNPENVNRANTMISNLNINNLNKSNKNWKSE